MKLEKLRKKKYEWTDAYIFGNLCSNYFNGKKNRTIENLEIILALMQYRSLKQYGVPLLVFKTYIYDGKIYHEYLSDMLRVTYPEFLVDTYYLIWEKVKKYNYDKMLQDYAKLSKEQLEEELQKILVSKDLNKDYFILEKPSHIRKYRLKARYDCNNRWLTCFLENFVALWIISILYYFLTMVVNVPFFVKYDDILVAIGGLAPFVILDVIIVSCILFRPTKFESKNGYDSKNN